LYECDCEKCRTERLTLAAGGKKLPENDSLKKAAEKAYEHLYSKGAYRPEDLTDEPYRNLITETYKVFDFALQDNAIPASMKQALQSDAFLFGGMKTHAQLFEADKLLMKDGNVKSFNELKNEFEELNVKYNQNYLAAEYEFAVNSSQMAAKWTDFDDTGRYWLQYRTAGDDRVRVSHAELNGTTLPKEDEFWENYLPPNGWNCRCQTIEVLKDDYRKSNSKDAMQAGEKATTQLNKSGQNKLAIFRFNPGKEEKLFPPKHPYYKVKDGENAKKTIEGIAKENIEQKTIAEVAEEQKRKDYKTLHKNTDFENNLRKLEDEVKNAYPHINIEQINSVNMYTGRFYKEINAFNRTGDVPFDKENGITKAYYQALTRTINKTLDEIPDKYTGEVYRGTYLNDKLVKQYKTAFEKGKPIIEKSFTSTSYSRSESFSGNVALKIASKRGTIVEKISEHPSENEVLFKANAKFKVTDFKDFKNGKYEIYMEEL